MLVTEYDAELRLVGWNEEMARSHPSIAQLRGKSVSEFAEHAYLRYLLLVQVGMSGVADELALELDGLGPGIFRVEPRPDGYLATWTPTGRDAIPQVAA